MNKAKIKLKCYKCGWETWRKWKRWFTDKELTCPKCATYGGLEIVEQ